MIQNALFEEPPYQPPSSGSVVLRPYQVRSVEAIQAERAKGIKRTLIVQPTGTGKTTIFTELARQELERGGSVVILAHRQELLEQARDRMLQQIGRDVPVGIEAGSDRAPRHSRIVIAGVQTIGRKSSPRLDWMRPTLVTCDEAHHAPADSYMESFRRFGCFDDGADLLGVTATPHRLDNRPLHGSEKAIFESIAYEYTLRDAILDKWLCDIRGFRARAGYSLEGVKTTAGDYNQRQLDERVNTSNENLSALKHWREVASDRRTIVFCVSVDHAKEMAAVFNDHGHPATYVSGDMDRDVRSERIRAFRRGDVQVLTNCEIATEGFDVPEIACVLLLRPTKSWALYTQMVGRGLRILDGKPDCIVLDVVGVSDDHKLAGVPGILGAPRVNMNGATATELIAKIDGLSEYQKGLLGQREIDFDSIDEVLREVDILGELSPCEEVKRASRYSWMKFGEDRYVLSCGDERDGDEKRREAVLQADALGIWHITVRSSKVNKSMVIGADFEEAIKKCDAAVDDEWRGISALIDANASWRRRPPTDKQKVWLRKFGLGEHVIAEMDMGQATAYLSKKFGEKKR